MRLQKNTKGKKKEGNLNKLMMQNDEEVIISSKGEYWKYILSDEQCEEASYGLLYFTHSFIKKFEKNEFNVSKELLANTFMDIRSHLIDLLESLRDVEKVITRANLTKECAVICECLQIIPTSKVYKMGKNLKIFSGARGMEVDEIDKNMMGDSDNEDMNTMEVQTQAQFVD